jgi:predicted AAA+ superfamily ATPase
MGRYFLFRMHPVTIAELIRADLPAQEIIRPAQAVEEDAFSALWRHGGYPEPFLAANDRFSRRWRRLRHAQIFKEDLRDLTRIQDLTTLEIMGRMLEERSSEQLILSNLARNLGIAPNTAKSWVNTLCSLHVGFLVRPWYRNIASSLRKEPKWFLRDWSGIRDVGQRTETFIACHLLKAVEAWTDLGLGEFELRYIRDKQGREVDFVVVRDGEPWFLVEAKHGATGLSRNLPLFQEKTGARHAFQVMLSADYVEADCFAREKPTIVPARTLLSQLI